jgi:hypothetical protein
MRRTISGACAELRVLQRRLCMSSEFETGATALCKGRSPEEIVRDQVLKFTRPGPSNQFPTDNMGAIGLLHLADKIAHISHHCLVTNG